MYGPCETTPHHAISHYCDEADPVLSVAADLEQALQKAMRVVGMDGADVKRRVIVGTPKAREQMLLARIAELEEQLEAK